MRRLLIALVGMLAAFGALVPASADTRTETQYYSRPMDTLEFRLDGTETNITISIEDDLHWNVSAYYGIEKYGCTGGGGGGYGGGGSSCSTVTLQSGYFCRYINVDIPSASWVYVELLPPGLNKFYCGNLGGAVKGSVRIDYVYTPSGGGGGGCAVAPAYRSKDMPKVMTSARRNGSGQLFHPLLPTSLS